MSHKHCWCQQTWVLTMPENVQAYNAPKTLHDQCCVCGDRRITPSPKPAPEAPR